jgi:hypothetical protein
VVNKELEQPGVVLETTGPWLTAGCLLRVYVHPQVTTAVAGIRASRWTFLVIVPIRITTRHRIDCLAVDWRSVGRSLGGSVRHIAVLVLPSVRYDFPSAIERFATSRSS